MPDAPAPTTASVLGSVSSAHASSVPMTRPPNCVAGSGRFTEPVARMTNLAPYSVPSKVLPTLTLPSSVRTPWPSMTSMALRFISPATPPVSVLTTFLRRSPTAAKSTAGSPTVMPNAAASRIWPRTSATRRTAFAGMHA